MKKLLIALSLSSLAPLSFGATSGLNPSALKLKIYKVAISTSALCTSPVTVFETTSPSYTDFLANPTLGSGSVASGTYPCVMIEFGSIIKPTPETTSTGTGSCVAGTEFELNVCRTGSSSTLIDGTNVDCADGVEKRIAMYLSTASTETTGTTGHTAFQPPTTASDSTKGFNLASALTVTDTTAGTFVVNGTGKIEENGASCECQPPTFSFR